MDSYLATVEGNDIEGVWKSLLIRSGDEHKFILYVPHEDFTKLIIGYWKSIFVDFKVTDAFKLYNTYLTSLSLYNLLDWSISRYNYNLYSNDIKLTKVKFTELFDSIDASDAIELAKPTPSIEYLICNYMQGYSNWDIELFNIIKSLTWKNWMDEILHLRYEILSGTIDANKIDPSLNANTENLMSKLKKSALLKWTVDPDITPDAIEYFRTSYTDTTIFERCWKALYDTWGVEEDMTELNQLINNDQYTKLLDRDIARGYGCSYTRTRMMNKCNQTFVTYCYDIKRNSHEEELQGFKLK
jgi:hypothetical protein